MRKTFYRIFTIADYEEEELWLREQHKAGWKLVKLTPPCIYVFESCTPEDVIYRLDYKNTERDSGYMQMLRDFGWEYFASCFGWLYFRKPAAAAETEEDGELFSDNASRAEMAASVVKTRLLPLLIIFLCCIVPNALRYADNGGGLGRAGAFFSIFFTVMFFVYAVLILHCSIKLKRIRDRYKA